MGGSLVTDNHHAYQTQTSDGGAITTVTADNLFAKPNRYGVGKFSGEGISGNAIIQNVNNTNVGYSILGKVNEYVYNGDHTVMTDFGGSAKPSYKANVLSGIRLKFSSGNIEGGNVVFFKNHNALISIEKNDFTNMDLTLGAIYIVRDPRNVISSVLYHYSKKTFVYGLASEIYNVLFSGNLAFIFDNGRINKLIGIQKYLVENNFQAKRQLHL